jgi:DNA-binding CsgD family transcriptional regulator
VAAMGEAALAVGDVAMAGALADLCDDTERLDDAWVAGALRSQIDIACGRFREARQRTSRLLELRSSTCEARTRLHQIQAELELWSGDPGIALNISRQALGDIADADDKGGCAGNVLNLAMRACADLHQVGISQRANRTAKMAKEAADEIRQMADALNPVESVMHSSSVVADAEVTEWQAELARFQRLPHAVDWWHAAAGRWEALGRPHRAAYGRWRQAQALLERGNCTGAGANLSHAWRQAIHHEPLRNSIVALARRAGLSRTLATAESEAPEPVESSSQPSRHQASTLELSARLETRRILTVREGQVMDLVAEGLTSEQIGRRLGIAERTVRKHLSAVYTKAGLHGRAGAAAWWQRGEIQGLR